MWSQPLRLLVWPKKIPASARVKEDLNHATWPLQGCKCLPTSIMWYPKIRETLSQLLQALKKEQVISKAQIKLVKMVIAIFIGLKALQWRWPVLLRQTMWAIQLLQASNRTSTQTSLRWVRQKRKSQSPAKRTHLLQRFTQNVIFSNSLSLQHKKKVRVVNLLLNY